MLTNREKQILKLSVYSNEYIAQKLCLSIATVKTHKKNIIKKLSKNTQDYNLQVYCVLTALKNGLIDLKDFNLADWELFNKKREYKQAVEQVAIKWLDVKDVLYNIKLHFTQYEFEQFLKSVKAKIINDLDDFSERKEK